DGIRAGHVTGVQTCAFRSVAFAHGAGRGDDARAAATAALRLALMIGVPMGVIVAVLANPLAWLLGGRGDVLEYAVTYLRISCVEIGRASCRGRGWVWVGGG